MSFEAIVIASLVASTLCVRIISAPFNTEIASAAIEPNNRSDGLLFDIISPTKDLLDTETRIGNFCFIDFMCI